VYTGRAWHVLRDPEGNEFCILHPRAEARCCSGDPPLCGGRRDHRFGPHEGDDNRRRFRR
jgi:hypothetical protein